MKIKIHPDYFRNLIFGAEDALVSTVGVLFGIASASNFTLKQIMLTGLVVVTVEALSMGAGSFLTEESVHDLEKGHTDNPVIGGLIMFLSYFLTGLIILTPYLFFTIPIAKMVSVLLTLLMLFVLGILPTRDVKDGIRMVIVAGAAILIGYGVAYFVDHL